MKKSATALANLLDDSKDENVLREACLGLCQLFGEGIQNDRIQAILEADVVPKLVTLLRPSKSRTIPISVQSAALQVLGNVACGDDRQTQVVIDSDALPCLRALLSSSDRGIRKEVCWIVSNITESSHQVQDVLDADILPPLLKLLENQDAACREDATWVLFNLSSNRDPTQIAYLAEKNGVRALCNLLACAKDLDVLWKGCDTVAAVALKGLRNILISGHLASISESNSYNKMASLIAEAHGVERIELLTNHASPDVRNRARLILERMFGAEPTNPDIASSSLSPSLSSCSNPISAPPPPPAVNHSGCSCSFQQHQNHHTHAVSNYRPSDIYDIGGNLSSHASLCSSQQFGHRLSVERSLPSGLHPDGGLIDVPGSTSGSSTDSDPDDDDSDSDLIPPPPAPCTCVLCLDTSPLVERRHRGRGLIESCDVYGGDDIVVELRPICEFCSGGGRLGDGRAGLAAKLGRAIRLGHQHCLAVLLSRMIWSQRVAATEAPALLHPGGGPPDGGVGSSLPAVILAAQLGKPDCLGLLLRKCRPDLGATHGKKRLTALAWAAHKSFMKCCQLLIDFGANPATKCGDGVTALHLAASGGGQVAICKLLIDHQAPVNALSSKKQTPLCLASQKGFSKVVQLLLDHGADPNNDDEGEYTPLHLASSNGYDRCVELLLHAGAQVDATTRKGVTPLHYAVQGAHAAVVKLLISAGATVNCNRKPLLLIAADEGKVEVVQILLDAHSAIDCKANIKAMLDKETEVSDCLTPLHLASAKAHHEVVDLLLSRGANVNESTTKSGWSALDFAVLNGNAECAVTLLKHGAMVTDNCKGIGRNNWTLVQYAAHHGAKDVVRFLIQRLKEQRMGLSDMSRQKMKSADNAFDSNSGIVATVNSEDRSLHAVFTPIKTCTNVGENNPLEEALNDGGIFDPEHQSVCLEEKGNMQSLPSHRYDPRSSEGDEAGFGTGPGFGNKGVASSGGPSKSRRRVVKEDRQSSIRAREMRKRELEANEARERLDEAIIQRSTTKLTEAIAHVSKLVLHLATNVGSDSNGCNNQTDLNDADDYAGSCTNGSYMSASTSVHGKAGVSTNCSSRVSGPLSIEVGLGNEVQKARKILVGLLAEEKRLREEKEKEAADSRRENAQVTLKKIMTTTLQGGDPRTLFRAVTRATRNLLDKDDQVIVEANDIIDLISDLEKGYSAMKTAMTERDLTILADCLPRAKGALSILRERGGDGAAYRAFGSDEPSGCIGEAESMLHELRANLERTKMEEAHAKDLEQSAKSKLDDALNSNNVVALENALNNANSALLSKRSELAAAIDSAKKVLTKWVKSERRKLRQASNTNDPAMIEKAADAAQRLGLKALQSDIGSAKDHARKLREQSDLIEKLAVSMKEGNIFELTEIRTKLNRLGMFSEAEKARAEGERLQRAKRARTLLEDAVTDAKQSLVPIERAFRESKSVTEMFNLLSSWKWPDAKRLVDLSERAKKHGQSSHSLCETADTLVIELAKLGRRILHLCKSSDDARAIAAVISGFEGSFISVSTSPDIFGPAACNDAILEAKNRLAVVQAMDQESVKAESAQVKVEYAMATARRSMAWNRQPKSGVGNRRHGSFNSARPSCSARSARRERSRASETQSHSSFSSDYGDEDVSETESGTNNLQSLETSSVRSVEGYRSSISKKSQGSYFTDDCALDMESESNGNVTGECSHFYLFKEGTTVLCVRCGHLRSSSNPEWLARVKRRGAKIPPELSTFSLPHVESSSDLGSFQGLVAASNSTFANSSLGTGEQTAICFGRDGVGIGSQTSRSVGYVTSGITACPDVRAMETAGQDDCTVGFSTSMMPPSTMPSQSDTRLVEIGNSLHCERDRLYIGLGSADGFVTRSGGMGRGVCGAAEQGHPHPHPGRIIMSGGMGVTGNFRSSGPPLNAMVAVAAVEPGSVQGYGICGLGGLDSSKSGSLQHVGNCGINGGRVVGDHLVNGGQGGDLDSSADRELVAVSGTEDVPVEGLDLGMDFANENFGFDIDAIVDDNPLPGGHRSEVVVGKNGGACNSIDGSGGDDGAHGRGDGCDRNIDRSFAPC